MIFSIHTDDHIRSGKQKNGYSYGYNRISKHFPQYQHGDETLKVTKNDPRSQIQLFYMEPEWYNQNNMTDLRQPGFKKFYDHQYKIQGTHLEATKVWSHWIDSMNAVDEIWVGNYFARDAVVNSGITTPTYVFEHGIDDMWTPKLRGQGNKVRFLHVDSGSPRKRSDLVQDAFVKLFGSRDDVELTLKYHESEGYSVLDLFSRDVIRSNINKIYKTLSQDEMVKLFHDHDVLVYPSEGEGFGFIPLQALATGMPVVSTSRWCSYDKYFKDNIIESKLGKTTHTGYDHGEVVLADFESLLHLMQNAYDNINSQSESFYKQAGAVYEEYNWQNRVDYMLDSLINRVGIDMLKPLSKEEDMDSRFIYFQNGASYHTQSMVSFTREDPLHVVSIEEYKKLISIDNFRDPTEQELSDYLSY